MQHVYQSCISDHRFLPLQYTANHSEAKHCLPSLSLIPFHLVDLTFDLRSDAILRPVGGEDHCRQVSPCRVATQVQTTEGEIREISLNTKCVTADY